MTKLEYIAKCRAIFLYSMSMYMDSEINVTDDLFSLLKHFAFENIDEDFDSLKLIFDFQVDEDNCLTINETPELNQLLSNYLESWDGSKKTIEIYNSVSQQNIEKITNLSIKFCDYLINVYNMHHSKGIKQ